MRSARLSVVRQITSSRQSPRMSAERTGVALMPLLEATPLAVSSRVLPFGSYLSICVLSRSSRTGSASHHTVKLSEGGLVADTCRPLVSKSPEVAELHDSAPGLPAQMSSDLPRLLSQLHDGNCHR